MSDPERSGLALVAGLEAQPTVAGLGVLGIALGTLCVAAGLVRGWEVPPEGNLWETATFDGGVGIFLVTLALLAPASGLSSRALRRWAAVFVPIALYSYGIETVQAFRGIDPRFSTVAGPVDQLLGGVFFGTALGVLALFLVLAWGYFRAPATLFRLAVRHATLASVLSFGVGIWMSVVTQGRTVGAEGNLLPIHAAGFHALQAVPLVALLFLRAGAPDALARRWVHTTGLTWLGLCVAVTGQAASGLAPLALSPWTATALLFAAGWAACLVAGARAALRTTSQPATA
ncbi:MAG TPA: hypothetical protein VFQ22_06245 [Longimicrobiales bacterium]|nr:hypothetical protein [Longimicrobiales bacterium]